MPRVIPLDQVRIASPCPMSWSDMKGDERVRYCEKCELNVFNLSSMTRDEAVALVNDREGRLCVSYYQRRDGTILTRDCPVGWAKRREQLIRATRRSIALVGACAALLLTLGSALRASGWRGLRSVQPFRFVSQRLNPPGPPMLMLGDIAPLPPQMQVPPMTGRPTSGTGRRTGRFAPARVKPSSRTTPLN